jgi:hypothetical protein
LFVTWTRQCSREIADVIEIINDTLDELKEVLGAEM